MLACVIEVSELNSEVTFDLRGPRRPWGLRLRQIIHVRILCIGIIGTPLHYRFIG